MTTPDDDPTPGAEEAQEATQAPQDEYDRMSPEELAQALKAGAERTRRALAAEDAELERGRVGVQNIAVALPTPEEILAKVASSEKIEKEREERRKAREPELRRIKQESWVARCATTHARFADARLDSLDPVTREVVDDWIDNPSPGTLIFFGDVGSGKTYASFAVMREMFLHNASVKFWPVPKLLDALRPNGAAETVAQEATTVDVLVLDDIGAERPTDWSMERLYILVNDRWMAKKRTIITTNLSLQTLEEAIGGRMFSRFVDGAEMADFGSTDLRQS